MRRLNAAALLRSGIREGDAPADLQMGDQTRQVQLRLWLGLHPQGGELGALVLLVLGQEQAKVIGAGGRTGWPRLGGHRAPAGLRRAPGAWPSGGRRPWPWR